MGELAPRLVGAFPTYADGFASTSSDTTSLLPDTEDYLEICGRLFPNPERGGWSWYAGAHPSEIGTADVLIIRQVRC